MRKLLLLPFLLLLPAPAFAAGNPHPGCHGANEVDCRPDPQPDKGQDCLHSDDHRCSPTTTTTALPDPEAPIVINDPIFPEPPSVPTRPELPLPVDPGRSDPGGTLCMVGAEHPFTTSYAECPSPLESPTPGEPAQGGPAAPELPRTGLEAAELAVYGILLILLGLSVWGIGGHFGRKGA